MTKAKTVKVRIAVAVDVNGDYAVSQMIDDQSDADGVSDAMGGLETQTLAAGYVLTTRLALPTIPTVTPKVVAKGAKR